MTPRVNSDAERIIAVQELERAIAARQPALDEARRQREAARAAERARRKDLAAADGRIARFEAAVHRTSGGAYLNGPSLDRGTLALGHDRLRFSGWHGTAEIALAAVKAFELGVSHLPPRVGIPLVERLWPGEPRRSTTLLLTVQGGGQDGERLAVVADLQDGEGWRSDIQAQQQALADVATERADLAAARQRALDALGDASTALARAEAAVSAVEREIAPLRERKRKLEAEQRAIDAARKAEVAMARKKARR